MTAIWVANGDAADLLVVDPSIVLAVAFAINCSMVAAFGGMEARLILGCCEDRGGDE